MAKQKEPPKEPWLLFVGHPKGAEPLAPLTFAFEMVRLASLPKELGHGEKATRRGFFGRPG